MFQRLPPWAQALLIFLFALYWAGPMMIAGYRWIECGQMLHACEAK